MLAKEVLAVDEVVEVERRMILLAEIDGRISDLSRYMEDIMAILAKQFELIGIGHDARGPRECVLDQIAEDLWLFQSALPGWPDRPP